MTTLNKPVASTPIAEHNLKVFFADPPGQVDVDVSPSYAQGVTMAELLAMRPGAQDELLNVNISQYTADLGRGRLAEAVAAQYVGVSADDVIVLSGVDAVRTL